MADAPATPNPIDDELDESDRGLFDLPDFGRLWRSFSGWCTANPLGVALLVVLFGMLGYYYFGLKLFQSHSQTPAAWIAAGWTSENDQQHCYAVVPLAILLGLMRWRDLEVAPQRPSNLGLWWLGAGVLALIAGVRCVEGRYTILALPLLCYGASRFLFGRRIARILLFPCVFLLFMLPLGGLVQGTANLQSQTATVVQGFCRIFGVGLRSEGDMLISTDNSFEPLEVAGGCSGIRSLMAMMMLAALYAYFAIRTPLRGFVLFSCSLVFALIGNFFRVFSVVLVAKFMGSHAAHVYHDWSGFVFFPVAVLAMVGVGNLLNRQWFPPLTRPPSAPASSPPVPAPEPSVPQTAPAVEDMAPLPPPTAAPAPKPDAPRPTYDY